MSLDSSADREFGLYAILPTFYEEDGRHLAEQEITDHVAMLVGAGYRALLTTGSYGEFQLLGDDERTRVVEIVRSVDPTVSIMACAAHAATEATVALSHALAAAGATSVMIAPPPGLEMRDVDIVDHFAQVAHRVEAPLVVYNNPAFGVDLSAEVLAAIAPFAHAIKQGTRDLSRLVTGIRAIRGSNDRTEIYTASDGMVLSAIGLDVDGLTSTNSSVFPSAFVELCAAVRRNDIVRAGRIHSAMDPYWQVIGRLGQPRSVKAGVSIRSGRPVATMRLPFSALDDSELAALRDSIESSDRRLSEVLPA